MASKISAPFRRPAQRSALTALALACALGVVGSASAQDAGAGQPRFSAGPAAGHSSVVPGSPLRVTGTGLVPGQFVTLHAPSLGAGVSGGGVVDAEGRFEAALRVPEGAAAGDYEVAAALSNPSGATTLSLHVSPFLPLSGDEAFTVVGRKAAPGLYQTAFSPKTGKLFATSAVGRPPVKESALLRVNPQTLEVEASVTPAEAPARPDGSAWGVYAVYGLGVDDAHGHIWTTNTRQDTIAVYRQSDLSLVKQFPPGSAVHARDAVVDEARGRVYISAARGASVLEIFDTTSLERVGAVELKSNIPGKEFTPMSLELDLVNNRLYTVSMPSDEWTAVDLLTGQVIETHPIPGAKGASGVAFDPVTGRLYVASQQSDNLVILEAATNKVVAEVPVGAGALNVAFEPKHRIVYVANRGAGTIVALNPDGEILANLPGGVYANHVAEDGLGDVFTTDRAINAEDPAGDLIRRIAPRAPLAN